VLLAPAAALPALLPRLSGALPVVVPIDGLVVPEPVVPIDEPVVVPVAVDPPAVEPPPAEPAPVCARANVLVNASAVANPIVASRMMIFLVFFRQEENGGAPTDVPVLMGM